MCPGLTWSSAAPAPNNQTIVLWSLEPGTDLVAAKVQAGMSSERRFHLQREPLLGAASALGVLGVLLGAAA